jgi:hypothetical protein
MESKNLSQEITIREFIEKEKNLFTATSIFAALCLFAKEFLSGTLGEGISFLFLSAFVLLWLEIWKNFPKETNITFSLMCFKTTLVFIGFAIMFYWLGRAWFLSRGYFLLVVWLFTLALFGIPIFDKIFPKIREKVKRKELKEFIIDVIVLVFLPLSLFVIGFLIEKFSFFLNSIFEKYIK